MLAFVAIFLSTAYAAEKDPECKLRVDGYQHLSVYSPDASASGAGSWIKIEADRACSSQHGRSFELTDVTLTIQSQGKRLSRVHSKIGRIYPGRSKFLLGPVSSPVEPGLIPLVSLVSVDLKAGTVRAPTGVYLNLREAKAQKTVPRSR